MNWLKRFLYIVLWFLIFSVCGRATVWLCSHTLENFIENVALLNTLTIIVVLGGSVTLATLAAQFLKNKLPMIFEYNRY